MSFSCLFQKGLYNVIKLEKATRCEAGAQSHGSTDLMRRGW
jgi:hypothetical protein